MESAARALDDAVRPAAPALRERGPAREGHPPKQMQHVSGHQMPESARVVSLKLLNQETAVGSVREPAEKTERTGGYREIATKQSAGFTLRLAIDTLS
jgi:hypothetical protein